MNYNISINLGSLWEMLSAVGTVAAAAIAIWLAWDERRSKVYATLVWSDGTEYRTKLFLHNPSNKEFVIQQIEYRYCGKQYDGPDFLNDYHLQGDMVLLPHESKTIFLEMPEGICADLRHEEYCNIVADQFLPRYKKSRDIRRRFMVIIKNIDGKKFKSVQKLSKAKMIELLFGQQFFSGFNIG